MKENPLSQRQHNDGLHFLHTYRQEFLLTHLTGQFLLQYCQPEILTGGIEKCSVKENIRKILKVSHFHLGFS